jgi:hypothetical protein
MKKITAAFLATFMVAGLAVPAMAWPEGKCPFTEASMCVVGSIASTD